MHTYIRSVVFLYFLALIAEEGFLISPCHSLELCIQMGISFLFSFAFHFSAQLFVRPPQTTILPFLHFFFLGMVLIIASCTIVWTSVHSSSSTHSALIPWSICHFHCRIIKDLIWVIPEWSSGFPYFLQFKSEFFIRSSWSEPQSASGLVFADCIELLHLWLQRMNQSDFGVENLVDVHV